MMYKYTAIVNLKDGDTPRRFECAGLDTRINVNMVCCSAVAECKDDATFTEWVTELKEFVKDVMRPEFKSLESVESLDSRRARLWWMP